MICGMTILTVSLQRQPATQRMVRGPLIRRQPFNNRLHLRIRVDPEALVLGHAR